MDPRKTGSETSMLILPHLRLGSTIKYDVLITLLGVESKETRTFRLSRNYMIIFSAIGNLFIPNPRPSTLGPPHPLIALSIIEFPYVLISYLRIWYLRISFLLSD